MVASHNHYFCSVASYFSYLMQFSGVIQQFLFQRSSPLRILHGPGNEFTFFVVVGAVSVMKVMQKNSFWLQFTDDVINCSYNFWISVPDMSVSHYQRF